MKIQPRKTEKARTEGDVLVLSGYGLSLKVDRGRLIITDGFANEGERRTTILARGKNPIRRLVIVGHSGTISLESVSWLMDAEVTTSFINADGEVITTLSPIIRSAPMIRRSQALAPYSGAAPELARYLLHEKIRGQIESLNYIADKGSKFGWFADRDKQYYQTQKIMDSIEKSLSETSNVEQFLMLEGQAASAYWRAWKGIPLTWPKWAASRVPEHWSQVQLRTSGKTGSARHATDPANAVINFVYSLLEIEARNACLIAGLDPEFGILHADKDNRTSFVYDLMEPARPIVDRFVFDYLLKHSFKPNEVHESREGICRLDPVLIEDLANKFPNVQSVLKKTTITVKQILARHAMDGFYVNAKTGASITKENKQSEVIDLYCQNCGKKINKKGRKFCSTDCYYESWRQNGQKQMTIAGNKKLKELREAGQDPAHGGEAARKRGEKVAKACKLRRKDEE